MEKIVEKDDTNCELDMEANGNCQIVYEDEENNDGISYGRPVRLTTSKTKNSDLASNHVRFKDFKDSTVSKSSSSLKSSRVRRFSEQYQRTGTSEFPSLK